MVALCSSTGQEQEQKADAGTAWGGGGRWRATTGAALCDHVPSQIQNHAIVTRSPLVSRDTHTKPSLHHPYTLAPLVCSPRPKLHHLKKLLRKWNQTAGDLWRLAYVTQENAPQIHRAVTCSFSLPSGRPHSGSELMLPADGDRRWPYRVFVGKNPIRQSNFSDQPIKCGVSEG